MGNKIDDIENISIEKISFADLQKHKGHSLTCRQVRCENPDNTDNEKLPDIKTAYIHCKTCDKTIFNLVEKEGEIVKGILEECYVKESEPDCEHSFIDADNEGCYGKEVCRFCGWKRPK